MVNDRFVVSVIDAVRVAIGCTRKRLSMKNARRNEVDVAERKKKGKKLADVQQP